MLGRRQLIASLMELSGRSAARTRPELVEALLRHAMQQTEADGAVITLTTGRSLERVSMRATDTAPGTTGTSAAPTSFERSLMTGENPRVFADLPEARAPAGRPRGGPGGAASPRS
jgi:hypothetical protein